MSLLARYFEDAYAAWVASTAGCCTTEEENEEAQSSRGECLQSESKTVVMVYRAPSEPRFYARKPMAIGPVARSWP